jgi:uncharacterized protein YaeQ
VALGSTIYVFTVELADTDRGVFETLEIRAAQHPSEAPDYLLTRVLAYCLEYREGIAFSKGGVSDRDEPTLFARDLTGALQLWVEIGVPAPERLHLAAKSAPEVALYCHKDERQLRTRLKDANIHRANALRLYLLPRELIEMLLRHLDRRMSFTLTVSEGHLYCSASGDDVDCALQTLSLSE